MAVKPEQKGKVAVCQITSTDDVQHNLDISIEVCRRAAAAGAEAIFLPEAADFIVPTAEQCFALSEPLVSHRYTLGLAALAKELGVYIAAGIHELPAEEDSEEVKRSSKEQMKVYNSHVAMSVDGTDGGGHQFEAFRRDEGLLDAPNRRNPSGEVIACYRKIHLFDVALKEPSAPPIVPNADGTLPPIKKAGESDRMLAGTTVWQPVDFGSKIGPVGLEICYDIRFPELHTILVRKGAKTIAIPSAFTLRTGKDHWHTLLRATAIQFQVYVLAPAQAGAHNPKRTSWGESLAFSPWGVELGRLPSVDDYEASGGDRTKAMPSEFFLIDVDLEDVASTREQIPLAIQKKTEVYGIVG